MKHLKLKINSESFTKRLARITKVSILFMFLFVGVLSATTSYSQNAKLTLKMNNKALKDVFHEIEKNSEYIFFYNDEAVDVDKKVNVSVKNSTIHEVLDEVLDHETSNYTISDRQVIIYKNNNTLNKISENTHVQQNKHLVKGKVTDEKGSELIGVSVVEKGTTNGVVTDLEGNYSISVNNTKATLVFSYISYIASEVAVNGKSQINVKLEEQISSLDEVVVVAYGTQKKSSITGSIASVKAEELKGITSASVGALLQGKIAGVNITNQSGQPGKLPNIRVRGTGTVEGNREPLWVVDGVIMGVGKDDDNRFGQKWTGAELNPNDIESISILKDGTATALYGSRGANGVVLVTTKKGHLGDSKLDISTKWGISTLQKGNLRMMNGREHYEYAKTAFENVGNTLTWFTPELANQNTNWWDLATQNAFSQNYNISYTSGTDKIRSYISGDYYQEEGTIKGYIYERFTMRANTDYVINSKLTLKTKITGSYTKKYDQQHSLNYTTLLPWDSPYNSKGELKTGEEGQPSEDQVKEGVDPRDFWYSRVKGNYLYDRHLNWRRDRVTAFEMGLGFDYKIFDWLIFESNNRFGYNNEARDYYVDPNSRDGKATHGSNEHREYYYRNRYTSQILRFLKTINDVHDISIFLGWDYDDQFYQYNRSKSTNMVVGGETVGTGAEGHVVEGTKEIEKNQAFFFNGNYSYNSKYMFQLSLRRDGSSRFGKNKKWANFFAVGGGWNMHEEQFIKNLDFINELKLRGTYGTTGNLPGERYGHMTRYQIDKNYAGEPAFYSNFMGNPDLSWEKTNSFDLGLDFRMFNRLSVGFDAYWKNTSNLLYLRRLSSITGFNNQYANDGELKNNGLEITVTPDIINTKDIFWSVSLNFGYNHNKIVYVPTPNYETGRVLIPGYAFNSHYLVEWAGVDAMTGSPLWFKVNPDTGEKTATGDYSEASSSRVITGNSIPKYTGGVNTNFTYKDFSLNASFVFLAGYEIYNSGRESSYDRDGEDLSQPAMKLRDGWTRWEKPGDVATHPKLISGGNNKASSISSRYLESGDFLKMKSLSISYNLPRKILTPAGIRSAMITLGGENLFTLTKFSGFDPEIYSSREHDGQAYSGYPTSRRFTLGLNLNF